MKTIITLSCVVFFIYNTYSQTGISKPEDLKKVQSRTMIVVLEEANNKKLFEKLDATELETYKKDVENYNNLIKEVAAQYWKFNTTIEYKTRTELNKLVESKSDKYAYLEYNKYTVNFFIPASFRTTMTEKYTDTQEPAGSSYIATQINIKLTDDNPLSVPVYGQNLPNPFPTKADIIACLKQIQLQFKYKLDGKKDLQIDGLYKDNAKKLQTKTLLIWEKNINLDSEEVQKYYPYPFKISTKGDIDNAIINADSSYAYLSIIFSSGTSYTYEVYDANSIIELARSLYGQTTGVDVQGVKVVDETKSTVNMFKKKSATNYKYVIPKDNLKLIAKQIGK